MVIWKREHRVFAVEEYLKSGESVIGVQGQRFNIDRNGSVPKRDTINRRVQNFRMTASAINPKPKCRPRSVRTPFRMSSRTLRRILHQDLHFHPYKLMASTSNSQTSLEYYHEKTPPQSPEQKKQKGSNSKLCCHLSADIASWLLIVVLGEWRGCLGKILIFSKEEYIKFYSEVRQVKILGNDWKFYNVKELEKVYNKVKGIAETKRIFIAKSNKNQRNPKIEVNTHLYYRFAPENKSRQIMLKKGKDDDNLVLNITQPRNSLPDKKKHSLRKLLKELFAENWMPRADLKWYKDLLISGNADTETSDKEEDEGEQDVPSDCLDEEAALHI
ncbi:unnamed protein product [Psylliodes chrysocephalus]|uniref:Uncharacterized protein n=1 Tax=Psylliodes chrysocephalus TaxID=3402493 RepID=A0A9P0CLG9_9CUCU|nr:unnamed protein product [Psylliodes chrysocephala]